MASRKKSARLKPELLVQNGSIWGHMGESKAGHSFASASVEMVIKRSINPDPINPFLLRASRIPAGFFFRAFLFSFILFYFYRPGLLCMNSGSRSTVVYFVV